MGGGGPALGDGIDPVWGWPGAPLTKLLPEGVAAGIIASGLGRACLTGGCFCGRGGAGGSAGGAGGSAGGAGWAGGTGRCSMGGTGGVRRIAGTSVLCFMDAVEPGLGMGGVSGGSGGDFRARGSLV